MTSASAEASAGVTTRSPACSALAFDDALQGELNAFSFGYQLGGRYMIDKRAGFAIMAEHNINRLETSQFRVFAPASRSPEWLPCGQR